MKKHFLPLLLFLLLAGAAVPGLGQQAPAADVGNPWKERWATLAVEVHLTEASVASASASHPVTVRLFDAQGQPRAEQCSHGERVLRLRTNQLPAGLYFVHIMHEQQVLSRQQLKIEQ